MKQGKHYTTVVLYLFLAAIVAYLGYNVISSLQDSLQTVTAIEYEAGAGYYATGFVVRHETPILSDYDITVIAAQEGARVAAGQTVATGYLTADAQNRQRRISNINEQIAQLSYAAKYSSSFEDQSALDAAISEDLLSYAKLLSLRDMNSVEDLSPELKGLALRRSCDEKDATTIDVQMEVLKQEKTSLETAAEQDTALIIAPQQGYFSANVDGFESVLTPERLDSITVREYDALKSEPTDTQYAGKLILSDEWYFVTSIPAGELGGLEKGDEVKITFARDFYRPISMRIQRVGKNEAGHRLLVLKGDLYGQNLTMLRRQSAELTFVQHSGLRVPKKAVRVNEKGQAGVYVLESARAVWKPITVLHDNGESYVVSLDKSSTKNLWPGDEIIVQAKGLYNGKVVQ